MLTRGRFVCHVHCFVHDGAVRSSPCGPHHENFENHLPQPSKSIHYTSYGNTPKLPPQYWVALRLSHQQLHKEIFDVGETQVFQNCNDKIVTTTPRSSTPRDTAITPK